MHCPYIDVTLATYKEHLAEGALADRLDLVVLHGHGDSAVYRRTRAGPAARHVDAQPATAGRGVGAPPEVTPGQPEEPHKTSEQSRKRLSFSPDVCHTRRSARASSDCIKTHTVE